MSKKRNKDRYALGKSEKVPFKPNESPSQRHKRRLNTNLRNEGYMKEWCAEKGIKLNVKNYGHHWIFTGESIRFDWWPSSAKFVVNKKFGSGWHLHDYRQVQHMIKHELNKLKQKTLF